MGNLRPPVTTLDAQRLTARVTLQRNNAHILVPVIVRPAHKSAEPLERNSSGYSRQARKTSDKLKFASGFHHSRIAENYDKLQFVGRLPSSTLSAL
jgi:hypothetical protein